MPIANFEQKSFAYFCPTAVWHQQSYYSISVEVTGKRKLIKVHVTDNLYYFRTPNGNFAIISGSNINSYIGLSEADLTEACDMRCADGKCHHKYGRYPHNSRHPLILVGLHTGEVEINLIGISCNCIFDGMRLTVSNFKCVKKINFEKYF